ncbi:MAG: hypothetical protein Kow0090_19450 [Myxococcota bacterium]
MPVTVLESSFSSPLSSVGVARSVRLARENGVGKIIALFPFYRAGQFAVSEYLKSNESDGSTLAGFEIYTFPAFAEALSSEIIQNPLPPYWLRIKIIEEVAEKVKNNDGKSLIDICSAKSLDSLLSELDMAGVTPNEVKELIRVKEPSSFSKERLSLIAELLEEYYIALNKLSLISGRDSYEKAIAAVKNKRGIAKEFCLLVSDFDRFGYYEWKLISALANAGVGIVITRTFPANKKPLFKPFETERLAMINELKASFENIDSSLEEKTSLDKLKKHIFDDDAPRTPKMDNSLKIICGRTREEEIELVACEIKNLLLSGNAPTSDIALFYRDRESYGDLVSGVLSSYGIPVNLFSPSPLSNSPLAIWLALLQAAIEKPGDLSATINFLCHPFSLPVEKVSKLTMRAIQEGANSSSKWRSLFDEISLTDDERKRAVSPLLTCWAVVEGGDEAAANVSAKEFFAPILASVKKILRNEAVNDRFSTTPIIREMHRQIFEKILKTLRDVEAYEGRLAAGGKRTVNVYLDLFYDFVAGDMRTLEKGGVTVADIAESRVGNFKWVFIVGANEGEFPARMRESPFLNRAERELFADSARRLGSPKERTFRDRFLFYIALSKAEKGLYVTYSGTLKEGREGEARSFYGASEFVTKVADFIHPENKRCFISFDSAPPYNRFSKRRFLEDVLRTESTESAFEAYSKLLPFSSEDLLGFANESKCSSFSVRGDDLNRLRGLDRFKKLSATALGDYLKCPFKYLYAQLFKVSPLASPEFGMLELGNMRHRALFKLFSEHRDIIERGNNEEIEDALRTVVKESIQEIYKEMGLSEEISREAKRRVGVEFEVGQLRDFVIRDLSRTRNSEYKPYRFEVSFGISEEEGMLKKPYKCNVGAEQSEEDGFEFEIRGKIDRIDKKESTDGYLAIDYKGRLTSLKEENKFFQDKHGVENLQLQIYLLALNENGMRPEGAFFYSIKDNRRREGDDDMTANTIWVLPGEDNAMLKGFEDKLKSFLTRILCGNFEVTPDKITPDKTNCDWCDYGGLCRLRLRSDEVIKGFSSQ